MLSLIAAVDNAWGLGRGNALLCYLPADLAHFKSLTMGKPIIMGRKTFESIGKPLPGRMNIVLSHHPIQQEGIVWMDSLTSALAFTKSEPEVFVIGGAQVYAEALPVADQIYLTHIHATLNAEVFFPRLDQAEWCCCEKQDRAHCDKNSYDITFSRYERTVALTNSTQPPLFFA